MRRNSTAIAASSVLSALALLAASTDVCARPNEFCIYLNCPDTILSTGHAWVGLTFGSSYVNPGATRFRGYHPGTFNVFGGEGRVKDDALRVINGNWDYKICWTISDTSFEAVIGFLNSVTSNPREYNLLQSNCVSFALNAASVAAVRAPNGLNSQGIPDPLQLWQSLADIGNGGTFQGGTVVHNLPNESALTDTEPFPLDFSYSRLESDVHLLTAASVGDFMRLDAQDAFAGAASLAVGGTLNIDLINAFPTTSLISVDWGDGSPFSNQATEIAHAYPDAGDFDGSIAVIDSQSVHRFAFSVSVGSGVAMDDLAVTIPTPIPNTQPNLGLPDAELIEVVYVPEPSALAWAGVLVTLLRRRAGAGAGLTRRACAGA